MTVVSELLQGIFYFYFVRKNITHFKFLSILWKPALASAMMGFVVWQAREMNLIYSMIIGAGVYGLILVLIGFIKKEDINSFLSILKFNA